MLIRFTLLILFATLAGLASATPLAESESCGTDDPECKELIEADNAESLTRPNELLQDVGDKSVFELLATRIVAFDLSKLLDKKTTTLLNTSSYSIGVGKSGLGDLYSRSYLLGSFNDNLYGTPTGSNMGGKESWNARSRAWAGQEKNRSFAHYDGLESEQEEKQQATNWASKTATIAEYVAVVLLGLVFWGWLRQSKAF